MGFWEGYNAAALDEIARQNRELLNELRNKSEFESAYYQLKEQVAELKRQRQQTINVLSNDRFNRLSFSSDIRYASKILSRLSKVIDIKSLLEDELSTAKDPTLTLKRIKNSNPSPMTLEEIMSYFDKITEKGPDPEIRAKIEKLENRLLKEDEEKRIGGRINWKFYEDHPITEEEIRIRKETEKLQREYERCEHEITEEEIRIRQEAEKLQRENERRERSEHRRILIDLEDAYHGATRSITFGRTELGPDGHPQVKERTLRVHIPKGVHQGQSIRLAGQGGAGIDGGPAGDLYLEIEFKPHPSYKVEGKDVYLELPVAPREAAQGAVVKVPTPAGEVELNIPPNVSGGNKIRLKGLGIPAREPGDFYVVLRIAKPDADTETGRKVRERRRKWFF